MIALLVDARPQGRDCAAGGLAEVRGCGRAVGGREVKERAAGGCEAARP